MRYKKIGVIADKASEAQEMLGTLCDKYDLIELDTRNSQGVDVIVALGGDGFMLHTLHDFMGENIPIYGLNCGTVGFLMNQKRECSLLECLEDAGTTVIHPLKMEAKDADGKKHELLAVNEISLLRKTGQAAKIRISVDDVVHMAEIVCDGMIVSTPAGSSAYNCSAGGPILPLKSDLLALTPISPFRPRRWKGAVLANKSVVKLDILKSYKRPVNAVADFTEVSNVESVEVYEQNDIEIKLLFDKGHSLEERIVQEQFTV
jgi:NAD+ kinase